MSSYTCHVGTWFGMARNLSCLDLAKEEVKQRTP